MTYKNSNWTRGELGHDPRPSDGEVKNAIADTLRDGMQIERGARCRECGQLTDAEAMNMHGLNTLLERGSGMATGTLTEQEFRELVLEVVNDVLADLEEEENLTESVHRDLKEFQDGEGGKC